MGGGARELQLHPSLEGWVEDYFYRALDWVCGTGDLVVDTTPVGVALNGLSHLAGVQSKGEFACALMRGLGTNLGPETCKNFAKEVHTHVHVHVYIYMYDNYVLVCVSSE